MLDRRPPGRKPDGRRKHFGGARSRRPTERAARLAPDSTWLCRLRRLIVGPCLSPRLKNGKKDKKHDDNPLHDVDGDVHNLHGGGLGGNLAISDAGVAFGFSI